MKFPFIKHAKIAFPYALRRPTGVQLLAIAREDRTNYRKRLGLRSNKRFAAKPSQSRKHADFLDPYFHLSCKVWRDDPAQRRAAAETLKRKRCAILNGQIAVK
jgi:hypothetical protein